MSAYLSYSKFRDKCSSIAKNINRQGWLDYFPFQAKRLYDTYVLCRKLLKPNQKLISIGAGAAYVETVLKHELNLQVAVSDFPKAIEIHEEFYARNGFVSIPADFFSDSALAFKEQAHLIICLEVIEHLPMAPSAFIAKLAPNLSSGGYLVVSTPNLSTIRNLCKLLLEKPLFQPAEKTFLPVSFENEDYHRREYVRSEIIDALTKNGLSYYHTHYTWYRLPINLSDLMFFIGESLVPRFRTVMIVVGKKS
jgi:2-polyprenyl-3-methyl-5-hydroxy-6-metoxy-1,4-benzoquinol methylase